MRYREALLLRREGGRYTLYMPPPTPWKRYTLLYMHPVHPPGYTQPTPGTRTVTAHADAGEAGGGPGLRVGRNPWAGASSLTKSVKSVKVVMVSVRRVLRLPG